MVACELDKDVSGELMGWKLPAWQALLLHRVLPSSGGLIVYLTLVCFDLALIYEHYQNGDNGVAAFCIVLMILPALISFVFTLASPPPGLQTDLRTSSLKVQQNDLKWLGIQFVNLIFFPVAAIGRYCYLIFWWMEAVFASYDHDEERTRSALKLARAPSPMELYLFLQAFIHSAPHTIVNVLDMMTRLTDPAYDKIPVQAVSIITSTLRMASTATLYRRFEREKLCGRKYPWSDKTESMINDLNDHDTTKAQTEKLKSEEEHIYESIITKRQSNISQNSSEIKNKMNSDLIQFSPQAVDSPFFDDRISDSDTSSNYLPPAPIARSPSFDSDDEYIRPVTIIDRVAPRRRDTAYTIERVNITPPPAIPAPRPGSLALWAEKMVENAESIPAWLSAPPRRKYYLEVIPDEPDIPRRVPRTYKRGLEPQDSSALLVNFLGWYLFFIARLLSIAAFINFFPVAAIIVLFSHYQVMLLFLIVPQASTVKRGFYFFLAFIYLFCLMEFKIRFRHVRVWHVFWLLVCTIEIIVFTALWSSINNDFGDWWRSFIVRTIFGSMVLSYGCLLFYFTLLQPREVVVYMKNKATTMES